MRTARIWLLVLLAVLLPFRGALGATMLCPPAMNAAGHDEHEHADHLHAGHEVGPSAASGHPTDGLDKCSLCCDFCSMTPLLSTLPSIAKPPNPESVSFPDPLAPVPTFVSEGQERPPRSI